MADQLHNELPLGWANSEFKDIVDSFKRGPFGSTIKKEFFVPDGFKVYEQKNAIHDDPFRGEYYIDKAKYDELAAFKIKARDFIVSCSGTIGRIIMLPDNSKPGIINQALLRIRIDERLISHKFFLYLFRSEIFQKLILVETRGSAMKNITGVKDLKLISIIIPSLPEQQHIVERIEELFSELDNGIENLKKAREQLETYRQAVLKYAFEGKLTKEWRAQQIQAGNPPEPAENLLERIRKEREKHYKKQVEDWKKTCELAEKEGKNKYARPKKPKELPPLTDAELKELPELPEGWAWFRLSNTVIDNSKDIVDGPFGSNLKSIEYTEAGKPVLRIQNIKANEFIEKNMRYISKEKFDSLQRHQFKTNDIIVTKLGDPLGIACRVPLKIEEGVIVADLIRISPTSDYVNYDWLTLLINSNVVQRQFREITKGTTRPRMNLTLMRSVYVPFCSCKEQSQIVQEIESRLSVCDMIEQTIEDSLKKAEAMRQSILKKAFAGELTRDWREKHPELISGENSAEKLLEKIKAEKALAAGWKKPQSKKPRKNEQSQDQKTDS